MASPCDSNNLLLFGGEYFNGSLAQFYNDLSIYNISRDEWRCITSPNAPLPRSGHAWTRAANPNHVYLFGGEFSSPKQGTFHHYSDFWRLEPATREWTKIEVKGKDKNPPARSGHRMTYWKQYIILFGGFQDTSNQTRYLGDLWIFDTVNFVWHSPVLPAAQLKPDARSSFTILPHEQGAVLYGGYSRIKASVQIKQKGGSKGSQGQKNVLKPKVHDDCFFLRMTQPPADAGPNTPPTVRWEKRKKPANSPTPSRAGATMTWHKGRGIMFGGVHDVEQSEEGMDSEFFNQLFAWNVERNRFMPLALRKPRQQAKKQVNDQRGGRRGRQGNEEELLKLMAALESGASLEDTDGIELEKAKDAQEEEEKPAKEMPVTLEPPHMRFNAQLAVQGDNLYIYGGTFEKGDREFTFDDLYAINLDKLDGCKEIFLRPVEDWIVSDLLARLLLEIKLTSRHRSPKTRMRTTRKTKKRAKKRRRRTLRRSQPRNSIRRVSARRSRMRSLTHLQRFPDLLQRRRKAKMILMMERPRLPLSMMVCLIQGQVLSLSLFIL